MTALSQQDTRVGTITSAAVSFDGTTSASDTGSDFQNRMLRSLRSASRRIQQVEEHHDHRGQELHPP